MLESPVDRIERLTEHRLFERLFISAQLAERLRVFQPITGISRVDLERRLPADHGRIESAKQLMNPGDGRVFVAWTE